MEPGNRKVKRLRSLVLTSFVVILVISPFTRHSLSTQGSPDAVDAVSSERDRSQDASTVTDPGQSGKEGSIAQQHPQAAPIYFNDFTDLDGWVQEVGLLAHCGPGNPIDQRDSVVYPPACGYNACGDAYTVLPQVINADNGLTVEVKARFYAPWGCLFIGLTESNELTCSASHHLQNGGFDLSWKDNDVRFYHADPDRLPDANWRERIDYTKAADQAFHIWRMERDGAGYWKL